jgi:hypothetical protein
MIDLISIHVLLWLMLVPVLESPEKRWEQLVPSIDQIEEAIVDNFELVECPLRHFYPEGMYVREITMPAGSIITSKIHKYESPFTISKGRVSVYTDGEGVVELCAPYTGITKPGTRRVLYIHEDTLWTTYHVNPEGLDDPAALVEYLTIPHENPLLLGKVVQTHGLPGKPLTLEEAV